MNSMPMTVNQIAELLGGVVEGDGEVAIESVASIDEAGGGQITFAMDKKRASALSGCEASAAIVPQGDIDAPMTLIRVSDVSLAIVELLEAIAAPEDLPREGVDPSATVAPDAELGAGAAIGPGVRIGRGARIGAGCVLCANVVIGADVELDESVVLLAGAVVASGCKVGKRVRIGPNSVIGADGFGYHTADGVHRKIPHIGNVIIEDDVELGACSCVDRAKFGSTVVGSGTKIDNLVQIAHNVQVGGGCILVAQCGVAGSTKLGRYVVLGGGSGVRDNVVLGDGVQCAAHSAIASSIDAGQTVAGTPARAIREEFRVLAAMHKLPDLLKRVKALESRLEEIEQPKDN